MGRAVETGLACKMLLNYYPSSDKNICCKDYHFGQFEGIF